MGIAAGSGGKVYSFEVDKFIASILLQNIKANEFGKTTKIETCFVGNEKISVSRVRENEANLPEKISLDSYFSHKSIEDLKLIKIDVDGGDYNVLLGASGILQQFHPIVIIEMTKNQTEIYNYLAGLQYKYICNMKGAPIDPPNWPLNTVASMNPLAW